VLRFVLDYYRTSTLVESADDDDGGGGDDDDDDDSAGKAAASKKLAGRGRSRAVVSSPIRSGLVVVTGKGLHSEVGSPSARVRGGIFYLLRVGVDCLRMMMRWRNGGDGGLNLNKKRQSI
jgi:hypothetical protein